MRVKGFVTLNGSRERLDWTIGADGSINEGPGLSAHGIVIEGTMVAPEPEPVVITDGYDEQTVTQLKVLLTQRDEPVYGNKQQLIDRLRAWDANNEGGASVAEDAPAATGEDVGAEDGDDTVYLPEDEGDDVSGSESE